MPQQRDRAGLTPKWYTEVGHSTGWPGLPGVESGVVIVGAHEGIAAFDTATGQPQWATHLWDDGTDAFAMNIATGQGRACIADRPAIACVDALTGRVLWRAKPDSSAVYSESDMDGDTWYFGEMNHKVYALEVATGAQRWTTDIAPDAQYTTRIFGVAVRGDTVYATTVRWLTWNGGSLVGDLVALDRTTGRLLWRYTTPAGARGGIQGPPLLTDRFAILNDAYAHVLIGVDRITGREAWRTANDASGYINAETAPIVIADSVFSGSSDTQIYSVDATNGALRWRVIGSGDAIGSLAVCNHTIIAVPFGVGVPELADRTTHAVSGTDALRPNDEIRSRLAVVGATAYAAARHGIYAFHCG
ncbi:MAG: PQQ-like beta-propeller repeat protein [Gemmatimonadota bacterium]|nr:PQQ-like beta-propeller repeat protein [Gemmatimonadota bacterium]